MPFYPYFTLAWQTIIAISNEAQTWCDLSDICLLLPLIRARVVHLYICLLKIDIIIWKYHSIFLTYYLDLQEGEWLLCAYCHTTARDINLFVVHKHHSFFEARTVNLHECDHTLLVCEKKKQNVVHWAISFCSLLHNQVVSSTFYVFCLSVLVSDYTY